MLNIADKTTAQDVYSNEYNSVKAQELDAVNSTGQTPTNYTPGVLTADPNVQQMSIAMAIHGAGGYFYIDSGAADAYVLGVQTISGTAMRAPNVYFNGMTCRFTATNSNTGSSTVNVATLGVKTLKKDNFTSNLEAGDIVSGDMYDLIYSTSTGFFELKPVVSVNDIAINKINFVDTNVVNNQAIPASWTNLDLSSVVGANTCLVMCRLTALGGNAVIGFRTDGETADVGRTAVSVYGAGTSGGSLDQNHIVDILIKTSSAGVVELTEVTGSGTNYSLDVIAYIK